MSVVYPIRVIDVEQTTGSSNGSIIFHKPTSWDFHTISHTWSKGVQSWSNTIGTMLLPSAPLPGNQEHHSESYEDLFQREDFSSHQCYGPFIEFLLLLQADGVRYVWLDALCINQASETGEKSQELHNMGSYYAKSAGCYVCAHGFGEGYQIWKSRAMPGMGGHGCDVNEKVLLLPRWFSRVWTLQESLLPPRLIFIFHLSQLLKKTINSLVLQEGVHGPCKCVLSGGLPLPSPTSLITYWNEDKYIVEEPVLSPDSDPYEMGEQVEIICASSSSACSRCRGYPLIHKPSKDQLQALLLQQLPKRTLHLLAESNESPLPGTRVINSDLYFIERECIVDFMLMALEQQRNVMSPRSEPADSPKMDNTEDEEWKLLRLKTIMEQLRRKSTGGQEENIITALETGMCVCEPIQVVVEAARRDCTREEDRILSILGLLGMERVVQLRAGKSLETQLLDMAQQLIRSGNETMLMKLCIAQFVGSSAEGMSWAPSLKQGFHLTGEQVALAGHKERRQLKWRERRRMKLLLALQEEVEWGSERAVAEQGHVMKYFEGRLRVESVQEDGTLGLSEAKVLWDCRFVRDEQDGNVFHLRIVEYGRGQREWRASSSYRFQAYFSGVACLLHRQAFAGAGQADEFNILTHQSVVRLNGHDLETRLTHFRVHLLLLGHIVLPGGAVHEVIMVCVGIRWQPLHKIGVAWLIPSLQELFNSLPPSKCSVGGFPDYMDRFVLSQH